MALVGYTNSGKSTLLNALTQAGALAEDLMFATLDPTTRCVHICVWCGRPSSDTSDRTPSPISHQT